MFLLAVCLCDFHLTNQRDSKMNRRSNREMGTGEKVNADSTTNTDKSRSDQATNSNNQSSSVLGVTNNPNFRPCTQSHLHSNLQYCTLLKKRINFLMTKATLNPNPISADAMPMHTIQTQNSVKQNALSMTSNLSLERIRSRELIIAKSLAYLDKVKQTLSDQPQLHNEFIDVLKDYKADTIGTIEVMKRIAHIFKNHTELMIDLNIFLPRGFEIKEKYDEKEKFLLISLCFADGSSETMIVYPTDKPDKPVVSSTSQTVTSTTSVTKPPVVITTFNQDHSKDNITSVVMNPSNQQ